MCCIEPIKTIKMEKTEKKIEALAQEGELVWGTAGEAVWSPKVFEDLNKRFTLLQIEEHYKATPVANLPGITGEVIQVVVSEPFFANNGEGSARNGYIGGCDPYKD